MLLFITGVLLTTLGLFSGLALALAAFGVMPGDAGLTLWLTFPALTLTGFLLCGMHGTAAHVRTLTVTASTLLLLLAVGSLAGLVLGAAGVVPAADHTAPLWFVTVVAALLGGAGAASFGRIRAPA